MERRATWSTATNHRTTATYSSRRVGEARYLMTFILLNQNTDGGEMSSTIGLGSESGIETALTFGPPRSYADLLALPRRRRKKPDEPPIGTADSPNGKPESSVADIRLESHREICRAINLDVLGTADDETIKIFSLENRRVWTIRNISKTSYEDLVRYCGSAAFEKIVMSRVDDVPGMFSVPQVRAAIGHLSAKKSLGDGWGCGRGCWRGNEPNGDPSPAITLVNSADAARYEFANNSLTPISHPQDGSLLLDLSGGGKPWFDFAELSKLIAKAPDLDFRQQASADSIDLWDRWNWLKQRESPVLMTGLTLATWIQSLWGWRPQVVILGKSKAGKSFLKEALAGIFRHLIFTSSDTTAAGLQQHVGHTLPLVFLDEFDAKTKRQAIQRQEILEAFRASSRGDGLHRGTSGGRGRSTILKHLPWIGGIHTPHQSEADRNRIISMELLRPIAEKQGKLTLPPAAWLHDLGQRLLACSLWCAPVAIRLADDLRTLAIPGVDSRIIESYAIPASIMAVLHGIHTDPNAVRQTLTEMLAERTDSIDEGEVESDEVGLMQDILTAEIRIGAASHSVGQLLDIVYQVKTDSIRSEEALASCGIKIDWSHDDGTGRRVVIFQYRTIQARLLKNTRWEGTGLHQILTRIDQAERIYRRVGGVRSRGIMIPWTILESQFFGSENPKTNF